MAQLTANGEEIGVVSCKCIRGAAYDPPECPQWQRWAINALRYARAEGQFRGKDIVVALPASGLFIDHLKSSQAVEGELEDAVFSKIRHKVPSQWTANNIVIKCIPTEQDNVLVIAAERTMIDRHLAIYERTHLRIRSMAVWPVAMANCHARLFAQRAHDPEAVVMLLDIQSECTNAVVCRGGNLLLARSIPIGVRKLQTTAEADRLAWELTTSRKQLLSLYSDVDIERLIFLSEPPADTEIGRTIAAELGVRAQLADCQVALGMERTPGVNSAGEEMQTSWALAFGLSLC
jgi:hypothetical protein